jgi:hypothetical protein
MEPVSPSALLSNRVTQIDAGPPPGDSGADQRLAHIASVLQQYTNTFMAEAVGDADVLDPSDADSIVQDSVLLTALRADTPALVEGPLDLCAQQWVGTARKQGPPDRRRMEAVAADEQDPAVTPWRGTLFTSSASSLGPSMWRQFLELYRGSDLFPLPWQVWVLPAAGRVAEVRGAEDWVRLIGRYPRQHADHVFPDWAALADEYDGVHISLQAVVAIQGFRFETAHGPSAPGYWDVETTHWLRWAFAEPRLVESVAC